MDIKKIIKSQVEILHSVWLTCWGFSYFAVQREWCVFSYSFRYNNRRRICKEWNCNNDFRLFRDVFSKRNIYSLTGKIRWTNLSCANSNTQQSKTVGCKEKPWFKTSFLQYKSSALIDLAIIIDLIWHVFCSCCAFVR